MEGEGDDPRQGPVEPARGSVRCECLRCGAHTYAVAFEGGRLMGRCGNCGGLDLVPVESAEPGGAEARDGANDLEDRSIDA